MAVGRPREFDPDEVLETVMGLFWEHGFEGVSISDLTDATGINRRSLYAEFGSKDQLFRRAVQRYMAGPAGYIAEALKQPTAWAVSNAMVHGAAEANAGDGRPRGCLLVQGALAAGEDSEAVSKDLVQQRMDAVEVLARRFDEAQAGGELPGVVYPRAVSMGQRDLPRHFDSGPQRRHPRPTSRIGGHCAERLAG